jgi:hypothetical protein
MELVASFANRSHLLKAWEKTDICVVSTSGAHGPKNPAITRMPVPRSATESPALFWPHRSRMTLLSATWAHASSFCAPYNSPPVHSIPTMVAALPQAEHDMKRATAPDLENGRNEMDPPLCGSTVVYLPNADKYRRLTRRPPKGQKVLYERALMASQRPFHSWCRPQSRPCGHTDPASAHGNPSFPPLRSLPHTCAGCGHGGTRKSNTSRSVQT